MTIIIEFSDYGRTILASRLERVLASTSGRIPHLFLQILRCLEPILLVLVVIEHFMVTYFN